MAELALMNKDCTHLVHAASFGVLPGTKIVDVSYALEGPSAFAEAIRLKRVICIDDLAETDLYKQSDPQRVAHVDEDGE